MTRQINKFCCSVCGHDSPWTGRRMLRRGKNISWACHPCTHKYTTEEMFSIVDGNKVAGVKRRAAYQADYWANVRPIKKEGMI